MEKIKIIILEDNEEISFCLIQYSCWFAFFLPFFFYSLDNFNATIFNFTDFFSPTCSNFIESL